MAYTVFIAHLRRRALSLKVGILKLRRVFAVNAYILPLHIIGDLGMLAFGLTSFFAPAVVARAVNFQLQDKRGSAEFRTGLGGFFIGLAVFALVVRQEPVFHALGACWLGGAIARLLSLFIDRPKLDSSYMGLFCLELTMSVFLLA